MAFSSPTPYCFPLKAQPFAAVVLGPNFKAASSPATFPFHSWMLHFPPVALVLSLGQVDLHFSEGTATPVMQLSSLHDLVCWAATHLKSLPSFLPVSSHFLPFLVVGHLLSCAYVVNSGWTFFDLVVFPFWPWDEVHDRSAYLAVIFSPHLYS